MQRVYYCSFSLMHISHSGSSQNGPDLYLLFEHSCSNFVTPLLQNPWHHPLWHFVHYQLFMSILSVSFAFTFPV